MVKKIESAFFTDGVEAYKKESYADALGLFHKAIIQGDCRGLINAGISIRRLKRNNFAILAHSYFIAAAMYDPSAKIWQTFFESDWIDKLVRPYYFQCYLVLAWQSATNERERQKIYLNAHCVESEFGLKFVFKEKKLMSLEQSLGMLFPFWIGEFSRNPLLADFEKISSTWSALHQHFKLPPRQLYLVYVKNTFNSDEKMQQVVQTMRVCGYRVDLVEWTAIDNTAFSSESVVAVLSDISVLAEPHQKIQQHTGPKLLISWQLPNDRDLITPEWSSWSVIPFSLLEDPLSVFFNREGLLKYIYCTPEDRNIARQLDYLQQRIEKTANLLCRDVLKQQIEILSMLFPRKPYADPPLKSHVQPTLYLYYDHTLQPELLDRRIRDLGLNGFKVQVKKQRIPDEVHNIRNRCLHELDFIQNFGGEEKNLHVQVPILYGDGYYHDTPVTPYVDVDVSADQSRHRNTNEVSFAANVTLTVSLNGKETELLCNVNLMPGWPVALHKLYGALRGDVLFAPEKKALLKETVSSEKSILLEEQTASPVRPAIDLSSCLPVLRVTGCFLFFTLTFTSIMLAIASSALGLEISLLAILIPPAVGLAFLLSSCVTCEPKKTIHLPRPPSSTVVDQSSTVQKPTSP